MQSKQGLAQVTVLGGRTDVTRVDLPPRYGFIDSLPLDVIEGTAS